MTELAVAQMAPLDLELMQELVGEQAAESLESALEGLASGAPLFVWPGDLHVEGNVSSRELLAHRAEFEAPLGQTASDRAFTIFIQGNLDVSGVLRIDQYHDVFVQRDVRARSIVGHTGNLVAGGQVSATEIVAFECNEEGGFLHAASCDVPLLCRFGQGGWEWAVSNFGKAEIWEIPGDAEFVALRDALTRLGVETTWRGVNEIVASGRSTELLGMLNA
jgi:hypothetical protein